MRKESQRPEPRGLNMAGLADDGHRRLLDLNRCVSVFIAFVGNKLSNSATTFYQKNFGLKASECRIIFQLAIEPGIPASRISSAMGSDKGPVSRILAAMQKRGLVAILPARDDGRAHSITLTARGRAVHGKVVEAALEREQQLLSCLTLRERELLIELLRRLHNNLDELTSGEGNVPARVVRKRKIEPHQLLRGKRGAFRRHARSERPD